MLVLLHRLIVPALALLLGPFPVGTLTAGPLPSGQPGTEASPVPVQRMDHFVRQRMAETRVPGVAYAVVGPTGIDHSGAFGTDGDGDGVPVTASTRFLWGSVAKPVAATLAMALARTGELRLDTPVTDHLPAFRLRDDDGPSGITVRQLIDQTSGIPTSVALTDRFDAGRRAADVLPALAEVAAVSRPGAEHHYSSTNYLLLTAVIEAATGRPYADVLRERVLDPLGMRAAITDPVQAAERLPAGHRYVAGRPVAFDTPYDPAGVGYGYLGGALTDAAAFARAATGDGRGYGLGWRADRPVGTGCRVARPRDPGPRGTAPAAAVRARRARPGGDSITTGARRRNAVESARSPAGGIASGS